MFDTLFLQILNMSFIASIVIIFVLFARLLLKKVPKIFSYALWSVVLFRLLCPFSIESSLSILPTGINLISEDIMYNQGPKIDTGMAIINDGINAVLPAATPNLSMNPIEFWIFIGECLWVLGIAIMLFYSVISLIKLHERLKNSIHEKDNIYMSANINSPFVIGVIRPKIYIPVSLMEVEKEYIILHEQTHINRLDHIMKILSFFALCLHWFNPLVWIAFFLSGRDMEMSCDERVIKNLGNDIKKDYASSLLALATGKRIIGGTPLAFGEGDTKVRIINALNYKKPAFWTIIVVMIAILTISIGLGANPINSSLLIDKLDFFQWDNIDKMEYGTITLENESIKFSKAKADEISDFINKLRVEKTEISNKTENRDSVNQINLEFDNRISSNICFNFNTDFTEVWVESDGVQSFSYMIIKPQDVQSFFEREIGSVVETIEIGNVQKLWKARTKYIGDNSAVGKLIGMIPVSNNLEYDHFELHTDEHPYTVEIVYNVSTEILQKYDNDQVRKSNPFRKNSLLLLALIDNADWIKVTLTDGSKKVGFINSREWAEETVGIDVRNYAESPEELQKLIDFILDKN